MRWLLLGCALLAAMALGPSAANAQTSSCDESAAALWAPVPWGDLGLVRDDPVVAPGPDESHLFRTLELEGQRLVAGVVRYEGRYEPVPTDSVAVWRLRCERGRWAYVDGFVDGDGNGVQLCLEGAELAVMRLETGTRVEGTFVRIEAKFDTCGTICGSYDRRFLLVRVDSGADRAFACTTHSDTYVVGAEAISCSDQERRRLVRYASGGRIRTRLRQPTSGPWVVFTWNGSAFVDEEGQSDCNRRIPFPR